MVTTQSTSLSALTGRFLTRQALGEGWLTKRQLYSPLFVKLFHGVHVPAAIPITHELRCRAAALIAPHEAVLTGLSAAAVRGTDLTGTDSPVEFVVPENSGIRAPQGMNIRRTTLADVGSEPWQSIRIATSLRMVMDLLTNTSVHVSVSRRVALLDALLREGHASVSTLNRLLTNCHDRGITAARHALALADPRAESVPESEMRVLLVTAGVPAVPQLPVYVNGRFLGRLDLGVEECKLAIEYDGEWHGDPAQIEHDERRRAAIRTAGWEFVIVRKAELYGDPRAVVASVLEQIRQRST